MDRERESPLSETQNGDTKVLPEYYYTNIITRKVSTEFYYTIRLTRIL